jgi:hypothetical protein
METFGGSPMLSAPLAPTIRCCVLLAGAFACATTVDLSREDSEQIRTIWIEPQVGIGGIFFWDQTDSALGVFGPLAAPAAAIHNLGKKEEIRNAASQRGIDIGNIVAEEFRMQLGFDMAESADADAILILSVPTYGLAAPPGFSDDLKPVHGITVRLERPDGTVIWQDHEDTGTLHGKAEHSAPFSHYMADPELLRRAWQEAAEIVVTELLDRMEQESR